MQLLRLLCTERGGEVYFLVTSFLDRILMISSSLAWSCSSRCLRASSVLDLQALAWSARSFSRALSAFSLWIYIYIYSLDIYPASGYNPLVFEHVTLHLQVQAVIHVVVSLPRFMVSSEQPAQLSSSASRLPFRAFEHWQYPFTYLCPYACPSSEPGCFSTIESKKS